ncbi:MAG: (2Fe-2S)-binding protein [Candidatus Riflebacteria bacterium HGW-Riflebacteria-1]|jgi:aerobic-type carbon monoxide dehydrogenase small subunit (CoxS/CutS family)|nr:MAG: (2Fe-2S)-binding protein [Candidatus Riflebacteria bacterium HGW-Riflebacteria-1]
MQNNLIKISFKLNGKQVESEVLAGMTVLELLRRNFRLTAAKEGCGKGECGACTIMLNDQPINSCLKLAATLKNDDEIISVEGFNEDKLMNNIQQAFVEEGAVQCGFCIPGMTITSYHLLQNNPNPDEHAIKQALSGNICRCTGYRKIEAAVKKAADRRHE